MSPTLTVRGFESDLVVKNTDVKYVRLDQRLMEGSPTCATARKSPVGDIDIVVGGCDNKSRPEGTSHTIIVESPLHDSSHRL